MSVAKFKEYWRSDVPSTRGQVTFFADNLLSVRKQNQNPDDNVNFNNGGWAKSNLNTWLNLRIYNAISPLWKQLIKPVKVKSSAGNKSSQITESSCYFYIPAAYEVYSGLTSDIYNNETDTTIPYLTSDAMRRRSIGLNDTTYHAYWTRSPQINYGVYWCGISETGTISEYSYATSNYGIALMFTIGV